MWVFFLHELIWYVFKKKLHHEHHIWIGFFLQKLNPFPLWVNFCHKWYILVVSFLNELIKNVYLLFRLSYLVKLASQMLHLNGLIPSWMGTDATCCLIYPSSQKNVITNVTFEWLLCFMNCFNMPLQMPLFSKLTKIKTSADHVYWFYWSM